MNITIKTSTGHIIVRPDTTWEKNSADFYLPDSISKVSYTPILVARIAKPGRSISPKFASRYYDAFSYGMLLYPEDYIDGSEEGFASASCMDYSSYVNRDLLPLSDISDDKPFSLRANGKEIFATMIRKNLLKSYVEEAIVESSSKVYLRTGDFLAIELSGRELIVSRDANVKVDAYYGETHLLDFNILA